ncbi:response regulator receiver domain-containing protein [Streptomyces sp. Amel2xB2]|uniref:response regulator n=1 Tax=Streptomyces sp. Amel2xB2 TaxID=1305829 RepID=UPI000DB9B745|nr:response regulator [Streptomyces sp. Amel2xB2]RAJ70028.1 response regulator receiver domain-containing protein [Streptomyces sp. Amel2xB2]
MTPPGLHTRTPLSPLTGPDPDAADEAGILLVDDREDNLVALEAVLGALEVPLVRAMSGEEAMKALLRQEFAVILLDVLMPGMDGFETAGHIKRLDQTRDVPIIFLTGAESASEAGYTFRGYATGAADYITKPFDPWMLRSKVSVFLELHRKNRQLQQLLAGERDRLGEFARRLEALELRLQQGGDEPDVRDVAHRVAGLAEALDELRRELP